MKNKFNLLFSSIINETVGFHIIPIQINQLKYGINCISVFQQILEEQKFYQQIPQEIIFYLKTHLNRQISTEDLNVLISDSKLKLKINKKYNYKPFYLFQIDLSDAGIKNFLDRTSEEYDKEDFLFIKISLQQKLKYAAGGLITLKNAYFYFLVKERYTERTIAHQFVHYLQHEFSIYFDKYDFSFNPINLQKIKHLYPGISLSTKMLQQIFFNQKQFGTHIDDLNFCLKHIAEKYKLQKFRFFQEFINTFQTYSKSILRTDNDILNKFIQCGYSIDPIRFFICTYILFPDSLYGKLYKSLEDLCRFW